MLTGKLEPDERLDTNISKNWPEQFSRTEAQRLIINGLVTVNGKIIQRSSFKTKSEIEFFLEVQETSEMTLRENDQNVPILYQDKDLAIVHKPTGMTVHPGAGTKEDTLVHSLKAQIQPLSDLNSEGRPGIVHRLDRDTEGLMLIAKNNITHQKLSEQFQERTIYKEYHAWLHGILEPDQAEIRGFISRNRINRKLMQFRKEKMSNNDREASLDYEVIRETNSFSLVKIILKTGRTHQIRCSFPHLHSCVVGDVLYSSRKMKKYKFNQKLGLLLVANRISFFHPSKHTTCDFQIDLPKRFIQFEEEYINA